MCTIKSVVYFKKRFYIVIRAINNMILQWSMFISIGFTDRKLDLDGTFTFGRSKLQIHKALKII